MSSLFCAARRLLRRPLPPRVFPTTGFEHIDKSHLVEEENWEWYNSNEFYPVRIGQVFKSKYQVVGKLGYGAYATTWLCRDLVDHRHVALKIGTHAALSKELPVLKHLRSIRSAKEGKFLVRDLLDEFNVAHGDNQFQAVVSSPMSITLQDFRRMFAARALPIYLLKPVLKYVLRALDFLHTEAKVIHTDLQESNILLSMNDSTAPDDLVKFENEEISSPSPRKIDGDRIIYISRPLVPRIYRYGPPVICDFGEARFGEFDPMIDIQPFQYRAPEVIFNIPWNEKVDIWSVGVMIWDIFENGTLFKTIGGPENKQDDIYHLAHMIALLGPPPNDLLQRSRTGRPSLWFDENGKWKGAVEIPETTLEDAEKKLEGDDKVKFLKFVRKMLQWEPERRQTAEELLLDEWLNEPCNPAPPA